MAGHPDPTLTLLRQLAADAQALSNRATAIATQHPQPSDRLRLEARIADLLGQVARAEASVRICSDMLTAIDSDAGVKASVALLRVHVTRALGALRAPGSPPPRLTLPEWEEKHGLRPALRLSCALEHHAGPCEPKTSAQELESVEGLDAAGNLLGEESPQPPPGPRAA